METQGGWRRVVRTFVGATGDGDDRISAAFGFDDDHILRARQVGVVLRGKGDSVVRLGPVRIEVGNLPRETLS